MAVSLVQDCSTWLMLNKRGTNMKKERLEKLDVLFNRVYKLSEILNEISMELANLIREVTKDEIGAKG